MGAGVKGARRPYRSPVRDEQAENTRRRAIAAAHQLFVERGYAGTTVAAVAEAARISAETVYAALGGKRGLLEGVIEAAIVGPEGSSTSERFPWQAEVGRLPTAPERLRGWIAASCATLGRTSPIHAVIRGAADREEFAAALRESLLQQRLTEVTALAAEYLDGDLRPGLTIDEAGQRYAALASPELYHLLTAQLGWTPQHCRRWLTELLERDLLGGAEGAG